MVTSRASRSITSPRSDPIIAGLRRWIKDDILGMARVMRWSYLPPLMVYFAAGVSAFTGIIESFFVKEQLGLTAAFLASLGFWAGCPWGIWWTFFGIENHFSFTWAPP